MSGAMEHGGFVPERWVSIDFPVIVLGGGGHALVLIEMLELLNIEIIGVVVRDPGAAHIHGYPVIGNDDAVFGYRPESVRLVNAIGSTRQPHARRRLFTRFKTSGYTFARLIHPAAVISSKAVIGEGVQVMAGAVLQPGCRIGDNVIVNTRAVIEHDSVIGSHTHISPGAVLAGGVTVGETVHVGAGATVIQGITIGDNSLVAAGAVVVSNVPQDATVMGIPAKEVQS